MKAAERSRKNWIEGIEEKNKKKYAIEHYDGEKYKNMEEIDARTGQEQKKKKAVNWFWASHVIIRPRS